ncbi:MAG: HAMP domain-containing histidine kinase [Anaerolineales bacterium]|nr:HAMP domain-containing histidine kinase [Anaerolineales bacterium]
MSLRARLALLYTSIVGGILFLFGMAVYISVSVTLTHQVDETLARAANQIISTARAGTLGVTLPELDLFADVYIQVWGRDNQLESASMNIRSFDFPLDPDNLHATRPVYRDVVVSNARLRVLTTPLIIRDSNRIVGILQTGTRLSMIDSVQRLLLWVLFIGAAVSMTIAGLAGWISTNQALIPLEAVTQTALQITRADDLSRRIPYLGNPNDEIGQLIQTFNQTLERLEKLFNTQKRFLADVGHELRTPLTVIKGNVDLMRRMNCTDDESMDSIETEVDRLTRMVGDLLLLAQAESGKLPLAQQTLELDTLVLEVMSQMRVLAKDRLTLRLGEIDQVLVCGDQDRLKQVLMNLIGNAIKYTPSGGEIVVGLGKVESRARLTVSDNGPGIPAEDLPNIFERFYRGEKSRTRSRDGKGFGLGLSIAYWIVRNHGGLIEVSNRDPHGTTFCVWLPLSAGSCPDD